jgi:uncharacterized protein (DUF58 family)
MLLDLHQDSYQGQGELYRTELAITTVASLANALHQLGQPVGFITNGRDAVDRIREEGWHHEFFTRQEACAQVVMRESSDRLRPLIIETRRGPDQLLRILETLARVELSDGLSFAQLIGEEQARLPRNTTVVAVLTKVSEATAIALRALQQRGYAVTAVLVAFDEPAPPDWAQRPDWALWLISAGIAVRRVQDEATLARLCSELLVR